MQKVERIKFSCFENKHPLRRKKKIGCREEVFGHLEETDANKKFMSRQGARLETQKSV